VKAWSRAASLGAAGVGVALVSGRGPGRAIDVKAFHRLNGAGSRSTDLVCEGITELGSIWAAAGASLVLRARGSRSLAARALAAAGATWALGQLLKRAVRRQRPYDSLVESRLLIGRPSGTSWPSSHPAVLLAFLTVAGRELELEAVDRALSVGLAGAVGISRVVLGVHFPSDVAGGLLLGRAVGLAWPSARTGGR